MATLTYPNTLTNATVADADQVMADLNAVKTLLETTKLDTGNLSTPHALFCIAFHIDQVPTGGTIVWRTKTPTGIAVLPVLCTLSMDAITDTPTASLQIWKGSILAGNEVLTAALTTSAADVTVTTSGFQVASIAGNTELHFELKETSGGGTDRLDDAAIVLWCKALLQA